MSGKAHNSRRRATQAPSHWTFFRQWLKSPLSIAAISPSSRHLARQMLAELPASTRKVVELGGGTGVFTSALLEHGIPPQQLLVLELNEELHQHLRQRFPDAQVECGDARDLPRIARRNGFLDSGPRDAVLSGLGLLSMGRDTQFAIMQAAFEVLGEDGRFIQFTYGPSCPVKSEVLGDLGLSSRRGGLTWWNMPPATVYVFTRSRSRQVAPVSMRN